MRLQRDVLTIHVSLSGDNDFLIGKSSFGELFDIKIHPDDIGGKILARLKMAPHSVSNTSLIAKIKAAYRQFHLTTPSSNTLRTRIKTSHNYWHDTLAAGDIIAVPNEAQMPQVPGGNEAQEAAMAYTQQLEARVRELETTQTQLRRVISEQDHELMGWRGIWRQY